MEPATDLKFAYENEYISTIRQAKAELSDLAFTSISTVQPLCIDERYWASPLRVMVMGQETYGNERLLSNVEILDDAQLRQHLVSESAIVNAFDFAYNSDVEKSPFWRGYQQVCSSLGVTSRRHTAFTNLIKVQLNQPRGGSYSVNKLPADDFEAVHRWQRRLARAEMVYAKPHVLVMFTGNLSWLARETFSGDGIERSSSTAIPDASDRTMSIASSFLQDMANAYTYHPGARVGEKVGKDREAMLTWLKCSSEKVNHGTEAGVAL